MMSSCRLVMRDSSTTLIRNLSSASRPPFSVLGVQQIAIGALDKSAHQQLWQDILGMKPSSEHRMESENVIEKVIKTANGVEIDLMVPIDPTKSPKVHQPPLNHVGLWVDNLQAAVQWLKDKKVRLTPGGIRRGAAGHDVAFIHPRPSEECPVSGNGVLIELVQAPASLLSEK